MAHGIVTLARDLNYGCQQLLLIASGTRCTAKRSGGRINLVAG